MTDDELFAIDEDTAEREVNNLAGMLIAFADPTANPRAEIRRIRRESGSAMYTRIIAERTIARAASYLLSDELAISIVGPPATRIAQFIKDTRMELGLAAFADEQATTD
ncbi:hypothetical protein [Microbacterium sp. A1-JK]|uniref:hypothetical protein n=1 Tax=Microbacterium sp. A1-JK TaxID=3177516 RepID=UPI003883DA5D